MSSHAGRRGRPRLEVRFARGLQPGSRRERRQPSARYCVTCWHAGFCGLALTCPETDSVLVVPLGQPPPLSTGAPIASRQRLSLRASSTTDCSWNGAYSGLTLARLARRAPSCLRRNRIRLAGRLRPNGVMGPVSPSQLRWPHTGHPMDSPHRRVLRSLDLLDCDAPSLRARDAARHGLRGYSSSLWIRKARSSNSRSSGPVLTSATPTWSERFPSDSCETPSSRARTGTSCSVWRQDLPELSSRSIRRSSPSDSRTTTAGGYAATVSRSASDGRRFAVERSLPAT